MPEETFSANRQTVRQQLVVCLSDHSLRQSAEFRKEHLSPLLDTPRFQLVPGRASKRIVALQTATLHHIKSAHQFSATDARLKEDDAFLDFTRKICAVAARFCNLSAEQIQKIPINANDFTEHIIAHYQLLQDAGLSRSLIGRSHSYSIFEVGKILSEAEQLFAGEQNTSSLMKTATALVFRNGYQSVQDAKDCYDAALQEALRYTASEGGKGFPAKTAALLVFEKKYASISDAINFYTETLEIAEKIFGEDPNATSLIKTAAFLVFDKKYKSIEEAKKAYDVALESAEMFFGKEPENRSILKTAAFSVFSRKYKTMEHAFNAYQRALNKAEKVFGEDKDMRSLIKTVADLVFIKNHKTIEQAKTSLLGQKRRRST